MNNCILSNEFENFVNLIKYLKNNVIIRPRIIEN